MLDSDRIFIISEVGSNHGGRFDLAERFIIKSAEIGADAVKFQSYKLDKLLAPKVRTPEGWVDNPARKIFTVGDMPEEWHEPLKSIADQAGVEFITSVFYIELVELLERIGVMKYKIASGDITYTPLLETIGSTGKDVILSTGASTLKEVETAVNILTTAGAGIVTLLHCVSTYPPEWEDVNLRVITTLKETFRLPVGISDHSPGLAVPLAAVALGVRVIEKHVTFHRQLPGPDHEFAMTFEEFGEMIESVRNLEKSLGDGRKEPSETELARRYRFRLGVYDPVTLKSISGTDGIWLRPEHHLGE